MYTVVYEFIGNYTNILVYSCCYLLSKFHLIVWVVFRISLFVIQFNKVIGQFLVFPTPASVLYQHVP